MDKDIIIIKKVAAKFKISSSGVSQALREPSIVALKTKAKIGQFWKKLNYEPNKSGIFCHQSKPFTIGVILPELSHGFFSSAISGMEDCSNKNKCTVLMGNSHDDEEREKRLVNTMKNHGISGLIVSIAKNTMNYEHFESMKDYTPVVFFDRIPNMHNINYVTCNITSGTTKAVDLLRNLGHKTIGMINGPMNLSASKERLEGYKNGLTKAGLRYDSSLTMSSNLTTENIYKTTKDLLSLKHRPTAIIAFNDHVLLNAVDSAKRMKFRINKDISFISFADLPISNYPTHLTVAFVEQFSYLQGYKAMEIMLDLLKKGKPKNNNITFHKIILEPQIILNAIL